MFVECFLIKCITSEESLSIGHVFQKCNFIKSPQYSYHNAKILIIIITVYYYAAVVLHSKMFLLYSSKFSGLAAQTSKQTRAFTTVFYLNINNDIINTTNLS